MGPLAVVKEPKPLGVETPFLSFQPNWRIQLAPTIFPGIIRFYVKTDKLESPECVSVALNCYDQVWEVHCLKKGFVRFSLNDTKGLIVEISEEIKLMESVTSH